MKGSRSTMGLFSKNKKTGGETAQNGSAPITENENHSIAYRDGVFEVYEDKTDGKKYGKILKYHGSSKVFEMPDEDFEKWRDAAENFGKYRITYERDDDFFIEKAAIELASAPAHESDAAATAKPTEKTASAESNSAEAPSALSPEDAAELSSLIEYYNSAVRSPDFGAGMLEKANLAESLCTAALCDRKINELVEKARKEANAAPGQKITVQLPDALRKLSENAKKALFQNITNAELIYVLYSDNTKRPHSAGGNAIITFSREAADKTAAEFTGRNQKVSVREIKKDSVSRELAGITANGMRGLRFVYKFGMSAVLQINPDPIKAQIAFPENIALRGAMTAFFQDLRNGVPAEKLKGTEAAMYDAMFRATFLQPCVKKDAGDGNLALTVSIIKDNKGSNLLDLFSSVELMEASESFARFKRENPENAGYKKWTFDELQTELSRDGAGVNGFIIDKENIPAPFTGKSLTRMFGLKKAWDENGKTFVKKQN